jgi:hypothetical protein
MSSDDYLPPECLSPTVLGKFICENGKLFVSDPCYSREIIDSGRIAASLDVKSGVWWALLKRSPKYPGRVSELEIIHESIYPLEKNIELSEYKLPFGIGVDTGQVGFFSKDHYPTGDTTGEYEDRSTFYGMCCFITTETTYTAGIIASSPTTGCGVVSSSGWGDGIYDLLVGRAEDGSIKVAKLDFLIDER